MCAQFTPDDLGWHPEEEELTHDCLLDAPSPTAADFARIRLEALEHATSTTVQAALREQKNDFLSAPICRLTLFSH